MSLKTIEQERACFAYNKIAEINMGNDNKRKTEYKSLVRSFASMILQNGLGQALAFLLAKRKKDKQTGQIIENDHYNLLYQHINLWLKEHLKKQNNFDILTAIREENSSTYRLYTKETVSLLVWLRKFAEAELPDKE